MYFYYGNPFFYGFQYHNGDYITASVDLNCGGPCAAGNYIYSSGMTSFSLADNSLGFAETVSSTTPGVSFNGYTDYVTLDSLGQITNWFLWLNNNGYPNISTIGNDNGSLSGYVCNGCGSLDMEQAQGELYDSSIGNVGTWQVYDVPEPSTWAMMVLGFAGIGFMAYRQKLAMEAGV
jgi:hypothetical protein